MNEILLIGLDLGTQGVRAMLADANGTIVASASRRYARINAAPEKEENGMSAAERQNTAGWKEQDAEDWKCAAMR